MTAKDSFPPKPGGMVMIYDRLHCVVRRSKTMRAVLVHARYHVVTIVEVRQLSEGYGVAFHYEGGDTALTCWADWRVLAHWLGRRRWTPNRLSLDMREDDFTVLITFREALPGTWVHWREKRQ